MTETDRGPYTNAHSRTDARGVTTDFSFLFFFVCLFVCLFFYLLFESSFQKRTL